MLEPVANRTENKSYQFGTGVNKESESEKEEKRAIWDMSI